MNFVKRLLKHQFVGYLIMISPVLLFMLDGYFTDLQNGYLDLKYTALFFIALGFFSWIRLSYLFVNHDYPTEILFKKIDKK